MSTIQRKRIALWTALAAVLLGACGGAGPDVFDWDRSPNALVASIGTGGGHIEAVSRFLERPYGATFVRLMGDGTLFGTTQGTKTKKLSEVEMQDLLRHLRPDLFDQYAQHYSVDPTVVDCSTTTIEVNVKSWGTHKVSIYAFDMIKYGGGGNVPGELIEACTTLFASGAGGEAHVPRRLAVAAKEIRLGDDVDIKATEVRDWPLDTIALSQTSIYDEKKQVEVTDQTQVATILSLLAPQKGDSPLRPSASTVFRQGQSTFWVLYVGLLP